MARTDTEVLESLRESVAVVNPTVDTQDGGSISAFLLEPFSQEISSIETRQDRIELLYSSSFAAAAGDREMVAFSSNYGIGREYGGYATAVQYFYRFTKPASATTTTIPRGTPVSTKGGVTFRTLTEVSIDGDTPDVYYNPSSGWYEISVLVQAVAVGTTSNVAAYTIDSLDNPVIGIDGTENRLAAKNGSDSEDNESVLIRTQGKMLGQGAGTHGGILSDVLSYEPLKVEDASIVFPTDWGVVLRKSPKPFLDVYVIGTDSTEAEYTYTAAGGEVSLVLPYRPVLSLTSLVVNSTQSSGTLVVDTNPNRAGSYRALDSIQLAAPLALNDVVTVNYTYNGLIWRMQEDLFSPDEEVDNVRTRLFNTDILVRESLKVLVTVQMAITVLSSYDPSDIEDEVEEAVYDYVQPQQFVSFLIPEDLRQKILGGVAGISRIVVLRFTTTTTGSLPVEVIELNKNQEPLVDSQNLQINATR